MVYAIAHIRGGGEMGRPWYEDSGKYLTKRNTFQGERGAESKDVLRVGVDVVGLERGWRRQQSTRSVVRPPSLVEHDKVLTAEDIGDRAVVISEEATCSRALNSQQ